jgi:hypothetical protein
VVRGIYVLEKVLGYTPPPPPPDVPELDPDITGATSLREELAKHREATSCAECHRKIDPLGFALENYDAIGSWRDEYNRGNPVDASGKLPSGDEFQNPSEFRDLMIKRSDDFNKCLAEKLLTYSLGRELDFGDREVVEHMLAKLGAEDGGLKDLVKAVVLSESFGKN